MFGHLQPPKSTSRIANLLRLRKSQRYRIALQFSELSPAISEPFQVNPEPWAA